MGERGLMEKAALEQRRIAAAGGSPAALQEECSRLGERCAKALRRFLPMFPVAASVA